MRPIRRLLCSAAAVTVGALTLAACGGEDTETQDRLGGSTPTLLTPSQQQAPNPPSIDGLLISASFTEVVLNTAKGRVTFAVDEEDTPQLGLEHLQSHAGPATLGFRVYYEQQGDQRLIKQAVEIPPPLEEAAR